MQNKLEVFDLALANDDVEVLDKLSNITCFHKKINIAGLSTT